jgi:16S rRNA (guanine966-N2)-methyltransferase
MRVITGEYKGRRLEAPEDDSIRPTSDKVKEAMFDILMNRTYGRVFCDPFAGTGSLGIEALSRGASKCYFGDRSRESIRLIRSNLAHVGAEENAIVFQGDYRRLFERIREKVDVFLLDPPYHEKLYQSSLELIDKLDLLAPDGIILAEHESRDAMPETVGRLIRTRDRKYGKTMVSIYQIAETEEEEDRNVH